jgi:transposase
MSETNASNPRAPRRRWALADKRRIVELTLQTGVSVAAIAREHGVNRSNLRQWQTLYQAGKLDTQVTSASRVKRPTASTTFVPVSVVHPERRSRPATDADSPLRARCVMQLVLATGATLRIETNALDPAFVRGLVAELQQ